MTAWKDAPPPGPFPAGWWWRLRHKAEIDAYHAALRAQLLAGLAAASASGT